jgi:peptidoglycan/LPS O-acetylase OafA/YrhL
MLQLGGASYSLYLFHMPILIYYKQVLERLRLTTDVDSWQTFGVVAVFVALSVVVSMAVFLLVEEPARARLTRRSAPVEN